MGLRGLLVRNSALRPFDFLDSAGFRTGTQQPDAYLRVLRGGVLLYALVYQHRYDDRSDAGNRYPAAAVQLRRLVALGLHGAAVHLHCPGQAGEEVFLAVQLLQGIGNQRPEIVRSGAVQDCVHPHGDGSVHVSRGVVDKQALAGFAAAFAYCGEVDSRVRLEETQLVREEQLLETLVKRQPGLLEVGDMEQHRQGVVVAEHIDIVPAGELFYEGYVFGRGGAEEGFLAAEHRLAGGPRRAVFQALREETFQVHRTGFDVEVEAVLVAGVEILVDIFETGDFAVSLDAPVHMQGQQDTAHIKKDGFNHNSVHKVRKKTYICSPGIPVHSGSPEAYRLPCRPGSGDRARAPSKCLGGEMVDTRDLETFF